MSKSDSNNGVFVVIKNGVMSIEFKRHGKVKLSSRLPFQVKKSK